MNVVMDHEPSSMFIFVIKERLVVFIGYIYIYIYKLWSQVDPSFLLTSIEISCPHYYAPLEVPLKLWNLSESSFNLAICPKILDVFGHSIQGSGRDLQCTLHWMLLKLIEELSTWWVKLGHEHEHKQVSSPTFSDVSMNSKHPNLHV